MRGDDGEVDSGRARVNSGRLDGANGDGQRAPSRFAERRQLGGCEQARIEVRERIPLDRRAEVQDGGVPFPCDREAGAEVFVRVDPLVRCHFERPVGRDDLAQQRQRPLHFEALVELVRLAQQLGRAALRGERRTDSGRQDNHPRESPHPVPRLRSVTRLSDSVTPASITTVVSKVS